MAKRGSKKAPKWLVVVPILLAVVAVAMMFLTVVKYTGKVLSTEITYTGWQVIFGHAEKAGTVSAQVLGFSFLGLLAILLPVVGACLQVSKNKIVKLIGAVCALAGTIMLFLMPNMVVFAENMGTAYSLYQSALGVGAIIAGVVTALETIVIAYEVVVK